MKRSERLAAIAAALVLVIGMGFGRFAFTALYPLMVADGHLTVSGGSLAASANYAGYLAGALALGFIRIGSSRFMCAFGTITTVLTLALLGLPLPEWLIIAVRGFAGISSAIALVGASQWLIHDRHQSDGAPTLFAGVGIGIVLSAEVIAASRGIVSGSETIWVLLAVAALVIATVSYLLMASASAASARGKRQASAAAAVAPSLSAVQLIWIYGVAGFGYIITATYLPLLISSALTSVDPLHIWAAYGLGAVPSCFFWHAWHMRLGSRRSLMINLLIQALGVALPAFSHSPMAYLASALLVGGTFMGTVTIVLPAARRVAHTVKFNIIAIVTAAYGVGQIIGPLLANALYARSQSFDAALLVAAFALVLGAAGCLRRAENG
jgi:hypothetical protein